MLHVTATQLEDDSNAELVDVIALLPQWQWSRACVSRLVKSNQVDTSEVGEIGDSTARSKIGRINHFLLC